MRIVHNLQQHVNQPHLSSFSSTWPHAEFHTWAVNWLWGWQVWPERLISAHVWCEAEPADWLLSAGCQKMVSHRLRLTEEEARQSGSTLLFRPPTHTHRSLRDFQGSSGSTTGYILSRACWEMWRAGRGKRLRQSVNIRWMCCWCAASMMQNFPQERSHRSCTVFEKYTLLQHPESSFNYCRKSEAPPGFGLYIN